MKKNVLAEERYILVEVRINHFLIQNRTFLRLGVKVPLGPLALWLRGHQRQAERAAELRPGPLQLGRRAQHASDWVQSKSKENWFSNSHHNFIITLEIKFESNNSLNQRISLGEIIFGESDQSSSNLTLNSTMLYWVPALPFLLHNKKIFCQTSALIFVFVSCWWLAVMVMTSIN